MGCEVKGGGIIRTVGVDDEDAVFVIELAQIHAVLVIVDTQHIGVEPYFASAEGGMPFLLEGDGFDLVFGEHIAPRRTGFDRQFGQVFEHLQLLEVQRGFERHAYHLRLAVRIGGKIDDLRAGIALRQVVFLVAGDTRDVEAFHVVRAFLAVPIDHVIDSPLIAALEDGYVLDIRTYKDFLGYLHYLVFAVLMEDDEVVNVGAIEQVLVFLEARADKAFLAVDIEFLVVLHYRLDVDGAEITHLGAARVRLAVFGFEHLEPRDGIVREVVEVLHARFDLLLQVLHQFVRLLGVELGDTDHADLEELLDIFGAHLADELRFEGREGGIDELDEFLLVRRRLVALLLIDTVLDEDLLQRGVEILLLQLGFLYLQLPFEERLGVIRGESEEVADGGEDRFLVLYHAAVGTDVDLAIREGIECVYRFVGRRAGRQLHHDTRRISGKIVYLTDLDFPFLVGLENRLDDLRSRSTERYLSDNQGTVVVRFLDTRTNLHLPAALAVVVFGNVYHAARREIGV